MGVRDKNTELELLRVNGKGSGIGGMGTRYTVT